MSRVKIEKEKQKEFLENVKEKSGLSWNKLGALCGVSGRTLRDWRKEKYLMRYEVLLKLRRVFRVSVIGGFEVLPENWNAKKAGKMGARVSYKLYGNPGTSGGRRKGGLATQRKFKADPEYSKRIGLKIRKRIKCPKKSSLLAEFAGVLLGDGGIRSSYQVTVSYSTETDAEYAKYLQKLIEGLFGLTTSIYLNKSYKVADIVVSSKNLVGYLEDNDILTKGNKIENKIDVPYWVWESEEYQIACLRGLMDTDGGVYYHKYKVNGKWYRYKRLMFTSFSTPLGSSVIKILKNLDFTPKGNKSRVVLYKAPEIKKYFKEIGTHNSKHLKRYKQII